jgi:hypothetical protein
MRTVALLAILALAARATAATYQVQPGIGFVAVSGAAPGTDFVLSDWRHREVAHGTTDTFGSLIFRDLKQGGRYSLQAKGGGGGSAPFTVLEFRDHPDRSFYEQTTLVEGFQYIPARDGTLLAAMVRPPAGKHLSDGPFPTLIEYSGYSPADPDNPQASTLIASVLGFATVGVNMRGSGCSGGVMGLFDLPTTADGYDIVETVAAQTWVAHGKPGMIGISFPGISQLYVGGARPPHLAAIAPLSVIADIYRSPGFPGGIFNDGFAKTWLEERRDDAMPAPAGGQGWARKRARNGDAVCIANQQLRLQTLDPIVFTTSHPFYEAALMDERSPINWVSDIQVPTFLSSSWQDEQTGGDFASMLGRMPDRPDVKISLQNGVHTSSLDPQVIWNWLAFLDLYVAETPADPGRIAPIAPIIYSQILGAGAPTPVLPADRFDGITDYAQSKALFESDPHIRVLMENGAGSAIAGLPAPTFELGFTTWPPKEVRPTAFYFGPNGSLGSTRPRDKTGLDSYSPDPDVRPRQTLPGEGQDDSWAVIPPYDWAPLVEGSAIAYSTLPLEDDVTIAGPSSVDLWLSSSAPDTDIQVTLSEIRPDGLEYYVQNGWLRASHRRLDRKTSTILEPRPTHLERQARPLPPGIFSRVRVGLFSVAHVFRKGSRIRIGIEAPGGDRTRWTFDTPGTGGQIDNIVARGGNLASRLVLPVVPDVTPPAAFPPCPGLRGQPCRTFTPATNGG